MLSLIELISLIETRPAMYLGKPHISLLSAFLSGWDFALQQAGIAIADEASLCDFQKWIEQKYYSTTTHGWHQIILYYSEDERTALTEFFKLFKEWRICAEK